jgi:hypothetical protein
MFPMLLPDPPSVTVTAVYANGHTTAVIAMAFIKFSEFCWTTLRFGLLRKRLQYLSSGRHHCFRYPVPLCADEIASKGSHVPLRGTVHAASGGLTHMSVSRATSMPATRSSAGGWCSSCSTIQIWVTPILRSSWMLSSLSPAI